MAGHHHDEYNVVFHLQQQMYHSHHVDNVFPHHEKEYIIDVFHILKPVLLLRGDVLLFWCCGS